MPLALRAGSGAARTIIPHIAETARRCLFKRWPDIDILAGSRAHGIRGGQYRIAAPQLAARTPPLHPAPMFAVTEAEAAAIRAAFEQGGEIAAAVGLRRLFPGVADNAEARECARSIAAWKPLTVSGRSGAGEDLDCAEGLRREPISSCLRTVAASSSSRVRARSRADW